MTEENDGKFRIGAYHEYLFPDPGDNNYPATNGNGTILTGTDCQYWKSQWNGYNKLYYNPFSIYIPWPNSDSYTMADADLKTPYSNPIHSSSGDPSITLKNTFNTISVVPPIIVDNLDAGFTTPTGSWRESSFENEWPYPGATHSSLYTNSDGQAIFTPDIPSNGDYHVYAWWNCNTARDSNAKITITHNGAGSPDIIYKTQKASSVTKN